MIRSRQTKARETSSAVESLARVQRWMQSVVTHPQGVAAGLASATARCELDVPRDDLERVVTRSQALTAGQRLAIYHRGYYLRLVGCLEEMLPALRRALGEELFRSFAVEYLVEDPPHHHTLGRLDEGFVRFLAATRPDRDLPSRERDWWPDFMIDLATLEHAFRVVFDGPGSEGLAVLTAGDLAAVDPLERDRYRLEPDPSLALHAFRSPVHRYLRAVWKGESELPLPAPEATFLALFRRDYRVQIYELDVADHALLAALTAGATLGEATMAAGGAGTERLTLWVEKGFFGALRPPTPFSPHKPPIPTS